jgi:chromosome segregation ATPase
MVLPADGVAQCAGRRDSVVIAFTAMEKLHLHSAPRFITASNPLYTANMSSGVSIDEFQALEQKVLRAVEIVKREREARASAEAEVVTLREQLAAQAETARNQLVDAETRAQTLRREKDTAESQIAALNEDRESVRLRVEKMLQQMDELL